MPTPTPKPTTPTRRLLAALALTAAAPAALAQYEITIDVENPTLLPGESTVVRLYAGFDSLKYAMAVVATDFGASTGSVGLSDASLVAPMNGPGTTAGSASATGYDGILAGQLNFLSTGYADPMNPIPFWEATYTAPIDVLSPFDIDLSTMTSRYDVYFDMLSATSESRLADLTEGAATIRVIPAPASASLLALGLLAIRRRRGQASSSSGACGSSVGSSRSGSKGRLMVCLPANQP